MPSANRLETVDWKQRALELEAELEKARGLHEAAARLAALVTSSEDAIVSKDLNGIITSWNTAAERIFGYTAEEIVGKSMLTVIPPELRSDEDMILGKVRSGQRLEHFETVRLTKSGKRIDVSITVSPVKDAFGKIIGAAKIARDITQQKHTEQTLKRVEKLAVAGRMAATIAHEINNPLEAIMNLLYLLRSSVHSPEGVRHLAMAEAELNRVSHLTKQTLSFYRESSAPSTVDVNEVISGLLTVFEKKLAAKRIKVVRDEQQCTVRALTGEVRQLLSNILDNAIAAAPMGGKVQIAVRNAGDEASISITDNGPGIPEDKLHEVFEPFFTTKPLGTGLGLWVARELAEKHGGRISIESNTDPKHHGTSARVTFRVGEGKAGGSAAA